MAQGQTKSGKKGRKLGRNEAKCARFRAKNGGTGKKITGSKRQRACTPLAYVTRGGYRPPNWQETAWRLDNVI